MDETSRRETLTMIAAGSAIAALSGTAVAQIKSDEPPKLREAFNRLLDPATRESMLAPAAIVIDNDAPVPMGRADYADHLAFHRPLWESRALVPYDITLRQVGETGIATAYVMDRGKPKNAGFRIRPSYVTAVFGRAGSSWQAVGLHIGPLNGQLIDISPG
jgi:hypothetical protein